MPYFDPELEADILLLPESQRKSGEIENVAPQAEADVIRFYTRRASRHSALGFPALAEVVNQDLSLVVFLLGYKVSPTDPGTDPDLRQALKETIAGVVSWRLMRRNRDKAIITESTDIGKTVTWNTHGAASFPPQFDWRLSNYDLRQPTWAL